MIYTHILHHGAIAGVKSACDSLLIDECIVLLDCCPFDAAEVGGFSLNDIKALVFSHTHINHVDRIPYLLAVGFNVLIMCRRPSAKLLPVVLKDAFKLGFSCDQQQAEHCIKLLEQRIMALSYLLLVGYLIGYQTFGRRRCAIRMYGLNNHYALLEGVRYQFFSCRPEVGRVTL